MTYNGDLRESVAARIARRRDNGRVSWRDVGNAFGVSPGTARRLYDEAYGYNAHFVSPRSNAR
jgi:hypothetical protein